MNPQDIYQPCPCGSGKKFKFCCYQKQREESRIADYEWIKLRRTEGELVERMVVFAGKEIPGLPQLWEEFTVGYDVPFETAPEKENFYIPWLLFNWEYGGRTVAELFLERYESALDAYQKRFITTIVGRPFSFYLIEDAVPSVSLTLKGLLLPEEYTVKERQASQSMKRGDIIFCRVLPMDDQAIMVGCAPYAFPPNYHYGVLDLRDTLKKRAKTIDLACLHKYEPELRRVYFEFAEARRNPQMPKLQNTDGDPLLWAEVRYQLKCTPQQAVDAMRSLCLIEFDDELVEGAAYDDNGQLQSVSFDWMKKGNRANKHWDNTVLGNIKINNANLTIEVNSENRAKIIQKEVGQRLGEKAVFQTIVYNSPEQKLKNYPQGKSQRNEEFEKQQQELMSNPEIQAQMKQMMADHWKKWFDQPIPALKGKTPRQAAKTKEGRERLEALLIEYDRRNEKSTANDNLLHPDIAFLRKELGLD